MDSSMIAGTRTGMRMRDVIAPAARCTAGVAVGLRGTGPSIEVTARPRNAMTALLVAGDGTQGARFSGTGLRTTAVTNAAVTNAAMTSKAATGTVRLRPPRDPLVV